MRKGVIGRKIPVADPAPAAQGRRPQEGGEGFEPRHLPGGDTARKTGLRPVAFPSLGLGDERIEAADAWRGHAIRRIRCRGRRQEQHEAVAPCDQCGGRIAPRRREVFSSRGAKGVSGTGLIPRFEPLPSQQEITGQVRGLCRGIGHEQTEVHVQALVVREGCRRELEGCDQRRPPPQAKAPINAGRGLLGQPRRQARGRR